jgi:hypothetical protein
MHHEGLSSRQLSLTLWSDSHGQDTWGYGSSHKLFEQLTQPQQLLHSQTPALRLSAGSTQSKKPDQTGKANYRFIMAPLTVNYAILLKQVFATDRSNVLLPRQALTLVLISALSNKSFRSEARKELHEFFSGLAEAVIRLVQLADLFASRLTPWNLLNVLPHDWLPQLAPLNPDALSRMLLTVYHSTS